MNSNRLLLTTILILSSWIIINPSDERASASSSYEINSFDSLPTDWTLSNKCDVSHSSSSILNNELVLKHDNESNPGASLYYGSLYDIASDLTFNNFTFEITFKMTEAINNSRWFGIMYHTNLVNDNPVGYIMNYRYNGNTASSCVNSSKVFLDDANTSKTPLSDNQYHTIKISMSGNTASHYIDGNIIKSWDVNTKNNHLGINNYMQSGKFSLIINQSTIQIKSIKITDEAEEGLKTDSTIANTYQADYDAINLPTVINKNVTVDEIETIVNSTEMPSNIIMDFDENGNVVDKNGNRSTFKSVYQKLNNKIIPIVRIESEGAANALISFLSNKISILDIGVMSTQPHLIKMVKTTHKSVRGILQFNNVDDLANIVATTNSNYALVAVIPATLATPENVFYIQARFKTVWLNLNEETDLNIYDAINTGAYGLICDNYQNVYRLYKTYDENTIIRAQFNSAHRGLPEKYNENSISGVTAAINKGATHIEIDAYLTVDNEIVIMHDRDISNATNGSGDVESYTLQELRNFKLDQFEPYEDIPTLDDIIEIMKDTNSVLILEIKSAKTALIDVLKDKLTQHEFYDQIVSISFNKDILGTIKTRIPELPTAYLGAASISNFASTLELMGEYNTVIDTNYTNSNKEFNVKYLRDHGIIGWYWTFDGMAQIEILARNYGYVGITNDLSDRYQKQVLFIEGIEITLDSDITLKIGDYLPLTATMYDGNKVAVSGKVFALEEHSGYYDVICSYQKESSNSEIPDKVYYTTSFKVLKRSPINVDVPKNNSKILAVAIITPVSIALLAGISLILIKVIKKKKLK